jgi:hypothetical protein
MKYFKNAAADNEFVLVVYNEGQVVYEDINYSPAGNSYEIYLAEIVNGLKRLLPAGDWKAGLLGKKHYIATGDTSPDSALFYEVL